MIWNFLVGRLLIRTVLQEKRIHTAVLCSNLLSSGLEGLRLHQTAQLAQNVRVIIQYRQRSNRVVLSEFLLKDSQSPFTDRLRFSKAILLCIQDRETLQFAGNAEVLLPGNGIADRQCAFEKPLGFLILTNSYSDPKLPAASATSRWFGPDCCSLSVNSCFDSTMALMRAC